MSWGNGAPRGWPDSNTLTPGQLTSNIPYLSLFLPAGNFTAGFDNPAIWNPIHIAAREQSLDAWEFVKADQSEVFTIFDFKSLPFDAAAPNFRIRPIWLQLTDAVAPSPTEFVLWNCAILNVLNGGSFDRSNNINEFDMPSPVQDQWEKSGGKSGDLEASIAIATLNGDTPSGSNSNTFMFEIERHAIDAGDTYAESAYLLGVAIQYKTDFANIAQWPV